jgi:hypothetical protein
VFRSGRYVRSEADVFTAGVTWEDWTKRSHRERASLAFLSARSGGDHDKRDVDATATKFRWFVDVPDRDDDYTALAVPDTGLA